MAGKFFSVASRGSASKRGKRLPGADADGVFESSELLRQAERSRSFKLKGETLVVGSNSEALQAAHVALERGSEKVTVVCVQQLDDIPAGPDAIAQAKAAGIRIICGWGPKRVDVYRDGRVSGAFFRHCDRAYDDEGRFHPRFDDENIMAQYCDNLVLAGDTE